VQKIHITPQISKHTLTKHCTYLHANTDIQFKGHLVKINDIFLSKLTYGILELIPDICCIWWENYFTKFSSFWCNNY